MENNIINKKLISLKILTIKEDIVKSRLFDSIVFQASIENEVVGYAKLVFIGKEKSKQLLEPFDFFIYKIYGSNNEIVDAYKNSDFKFLINKFALKDLDLKSEDIDSFNSKTIFDLFEKFKTNINKTYLSQFNYFVDYWVNKPNIELIRVLSDNDESFTDFSKKPYIQKERMNINWQNKGIGLFLYENIAKWCQEHNMELWASTNRTDDGKRMWRVMEKHPKFSIIMTHVHKYSSSGELLDSIERPRLKLA